MNIPRTIMQTIIACVGLLVHAGAYADGEANRLELEPEIKVETGTAEMQMPILMVNAERLTGFQCDLYLPEGFTVATDEYDDLMIDVARTTTKRHSLATRYMPDGALRIVLSSMTNATFAGNSGAVLNLTVAIASDVQDGDYTVGLRGIVLTDPQATRYTSADTEGIIAMRTPEKPVPAESITLDQARASIYEGDTLRLQATVLPANTSNKEVTWRSSKPTVAEVSQDGLVTALQEGTATITATTADGTDLSATCQVTVKKEEEITVTKLMIHLSDGQVQEYYESQIDSIDFVQEKVKVRRIRR